MSKTNSLSMRILSLTLAGSVLIASCSSTTMLQSIPTGAKVYVDGEPVGTTPHAYSDTKIVGTCSAVRLEMDGYDSFSGTLCRNEEADVGAIVGGIFFLVPFLWTMKYKATHTYELIPSTKDQTPVKLTKPQGASPEQSKADRLRDLKQLLDEGIITQEEFEKEKKKILEE